MSFWPNQNIVPVLTFHSVGMNLSSWIWHELSERTDAFEGLLKVLSANNYKTVTLSDLHAHMSGQRQCAPKSIVLVFDDGYLDNWVTVYPLLKKYGMRGTVYVNPEFVDPGNDLRPTLEDYRDARSSSDDIPQVGFMNWAELKQLDESGVLDVQSHALTHTWHFKGPQIVDFYEPTSAVRYPWMAWNARPERKPFYLQEDQASFVPWGTLVFEHEKSLLVRRYTPESGLMDEIVNAVADRGGSDFFRNEESREQLQKHVVDITGNGSFPGTYETEAEYESRVREELTQSKAIIGDKLNKTVDFLCWPGGGSNLEAKRIADEVGYKSWNLSSKEQLDKRNIPGVDAQEIRRMPALREVRFFGRSWGVGSERLVFTTMLAHQESLLYRQLCRVYKLGAAFGIAGQR